jgi:hypothetical protein
MQIIYTSPASSAETSGPASRTELPDDDYNDYAAVACASALLRYPVRAVAIISLLRHMGLKL